MHWLTPSVKTRIYRWKDLQLAYQVKTMHRRLPSDGDFPSRSLRTGPQCLAQCNKCTDATSVLGHQQTKKYLVSVVCRASLVPPISAVALPHVFCPRRARSTDCRC